MTFFAAKTHPGLRRSRNEDYYAADPDHGLWVVADGVGGHTHGDVASRIACEQISQMVTQGHGLAESIGHAHQELLDEITRRDSADNMGTTVVVFKLDGQNYEIAWVGDSRAYLFDNGNLLQLTHDHSAVSDLLERGVITQEQAHNHPQRHALSRSLGVSERNSSEPSLASGSLEAGQQIMICTDGLTDELSDTAISYLLSANTDPESQVEALVDKALVRGGRDNVTVVVIGEGNPHTPEAVRRSAVDLETTQDVGDPNLPDIPRKSGITRLLMILAVCAVAAAAALQFLGQEF